MSISVFLIILGCIDPKKFFLNLKLRIWYFFWDALQHVMGKKIKNASHTKSNRCDEII